MRVRITVAVVSLLVFSPLALGTLLHLRESKFWTDTVFYSFVLAAIILFALIPYRMTRVRLIFDTHEIRSYDEFGSKALAYTEVGGVSLKPDQEGTGRGVTIKGERLTIVGSGNRPSLSVFIYPHRPLDPRIIERLRELRVPHIH
jgi:hypothetical protein